jgi:hypothetical protein
MTLLHRTLLLLSLSLTLSIGMMVGCSDSTTRQQPTSATPSQVGSSTNTDASFVETESSTNTPTPSDATVTINPAATPPTNPPANPFLSPAPQAAPATTHDLPYATPVPGKPGFVTSPHSPNAGYVDVRGFPPGTEVKDPYSGKTFLVP